MPAWQKIRARFLDLFEGQPACASGELSAAAIPTARRSIAAASWQHSGATRVDAAKVFTARESTRRFIPDVAPAEVVDDGGRDGGGRLFGGGVRGLELRRREALARAGVGVTLNEALHA